jgi:hypothetical protein
MILGRNRGRGRSVGLDELLALTGEEEPAEGQSRQDRIRAFVRLAGKYVAIALVESILFYFVLLRAFNVAVPWILIFTMLLGLIVVRRSVRSVAPPEQLRPEELVASVSGPRHRPGAYPTGDGLQRALRRWETRLEWTTGEQKRFQRRIPGLLAEIVNERLRQHHGLTMQSDPVRAQALCGEPLWSFLHTELTRLPSQRELASLVATIEAL